MWLYGAAMKTYNQLVSGWRACVLHVGGEMIACAAPYLAIQPNSLADLQAAMIRVQCVIWLLIRVQCVSWLLPNAVLQLCALLNHRMARTVYVATSCKLAVRCSHVPRTQQYSLNHWLGCKRLCWPPVDVTHE